MTTDIIPAEIIQAVQALHKEGNTEQAIALVAQALNTAPTDAVLLYMRAHLYIAVHDFQKAAHDLDQVIALEPAHAKALDDRGVLFQMQGDYTQAALCHLNAAEMLSQDDGILLNLAIALTHLGQKKQAGALYHDVLQINPKNTRALINLGVLADEVGNSEEAENYLRRAHTLSDQSFELCMAMANTCRHQEKKEEAYHWYSRAVAQQPNNASAQFMMAAMRGQTPDAPPEEHVASLFDTYADTFEESLLTQLEYQTPQKIAALIAPLLKRFDRQHTTLRAFDLGAGTGLLGENLRQEVDHITAVDLSSKMLQIAAQKNIYDHLVIGDITAVLSAEKDSTLHLITAADVFIYVGDLKAIVSCAKQKLVTKGLFAFTTESLASNETKPFFLRDTGRYAHDEYYLRDLLSAHGFSILLLEKDKLRQNKNIILDGFYVIAEKV
jgi:predicted TPR repeat methyltransferase